ncbi:MAG: HAMP domain-containing sensor histidine kinase [Mariprofundus sp.]|nr:HAMP domain-containing sensor histidine kinase [Mariprofundus sp.]
MMNHTGNDANESMILIDLNRPEMDDMHLQMRRACHDLNAPLRAVHGFAEIVQRREAAALSEKGAAYLNRMLAATEHMEQVVSGLHHYARMASHSLQPTPLLIEGVIERLCRAHFFTELKAGQLSYQGDASLQWVSDEIVLQQLLLALIHNGLCFVAADAVPQVLLRWAKQGDKLLLTVSDHGIGIEAEYCQQVFDLFVRLHSREKYAGAGTGLAIVASAVRQLSGELSIDSTPEVGTSVRIILPLLVVAPE